MTKGFAVSLDRRGKAKKIEAVLADFIKHEIRGKKILDVGAGTGGISDYFSLKNKVYCIDVEDQRKNKKNTKFKKVYSEKIPFEDDSFDIVICNHVIEHVNNQETQLSEIKRVIKKGGVCYFATPNKLFPIEPHYKIPLIHYLPNKTFYSLLKFFGKYKEDLNLLSYFKTKALLSEKFEFKEYTSDIIKHPAKYGVNVPILRRVPLSILKKLNFASQTNVFVLRK